MATVEMMMMLIMDMKEEREKVTVENGKRNSVDALFFGFFWAMN